MKFFLSQKWLTSLIIAGGLFSCLSFHVPEVAEKIKYKVQYGNSEVGTLHANKFLESGKVRYEIKTDVKARLIKLFHVQFYLDATYNRDSLESALVKSIVNEKIWDKSVIQWKKSCYQINKAEEEPYQLCKQKATYSTALLYFELPTGKKEIFSESYTQYVPIKGNKKEGYELQLPSGNNNFYYYDNQGLKKAVINDAVVQLKFIRE